MDNVVAHADYVYSVYARDLFNLCQPLFQNTKVDSFHYVRAYKNGGYVSLNTNLELEKFMLTKDNGKFRHDVNILDSVFNDKKNHESKDNNKIHFFTEDIDHGYWAGVFEEFNIKSNFNII